MNAARLAVVGLGAMGTGIARLALAAGLPLHVSDVDPRALESARSKLAGDITFALDIAAVEGCHAVIDATPQPPARKRSALRTICERTTADVVIGTVTLAQPVADLVPGAKAASRVLGFHFMNPPHRLRFCELVVPTAAAPDMVDRSRTLLNRLGVGVVEVADASGFVLNRALIPFLFSAVRLLEQGSATAEDIDRCFIEGCAHPMGPLRILDHIGLDVAIGIGEQIAAATGDCAYTPPDLLYARAASGQLGRRSGAGLHRYVP